MANDRNRFIALLRNYDSVHMDEKVLESLDDHIETHDLSNIPGIKKKSLGAAVLAKWLVSVSHSGHINQNLREPRERKDQLTSEHAQIVYDLERIEEAQAHILGIRDTSDLRNAGLQTIYEGGRHYLHYESVGDDGNPQTITQEFVADFYPELQMDHPNEVSQNEMSEDRDIGQESLFYISNEIKKKDQSKKFVLWETNEIRNNWEEMNIHGKKQLKNSNQNQWAYDGDDQLPSTIDSTKHK